MPNQYTLILTIDETSLQGISESQEQLIIAKPADSPVGKPNVSWLSLKPWESNTITWVESYAIYASLDQVQASAAIHQVSATHYPATDGACYPFNPDTTFGATAAQPPVPVGSYGVINKMPQPSPMTFGLAQSAKHNTHSIGLSPINAQAVPYNHSVVFTPYTTVWVWLEGLVGGTVLADVTSAATVVTFGGSITSISLDYDPIKGQFVTASPAPKVKLVNSGVKARKELNS